jgi:hypothetical protein
MSGFDASRFPVGGVGYLPRYYLAALIPIAFYLLVYGTLLPPGWSGLSDTFFTIALQPLLRANKLPMFS